MIDEIDRTGMVYAPTREDISSWVAQVVWGMDGKPLMRNAWRKTGYNWFPEEGNPAGGGGVEDVSDHDDDDDNDVEDLLEDVLGGGDESDEDNDGEEGMM